MGFLEAIKHYLAPSGNDPASRSRDVIRYAALGITVGYSVALTYRAGGFKYLMPASTYERLVSGVEKIKEGTQPLVNKERFGLCSRHLIRTYSFLTAGCVLSAVGTRAYFAFPELPIGIPIAISATSAAVLMFARPWMTPQGKLFAFSTMCLATGVSFGPLNWVAYDTVVPFATIVSSTAVGFCAPLYITRGVVSYFCSAQLLSCSLSVVGAGLIIASAKANNNALSVRRIERDVSSMVTFQIVTNMALGLLHTVPTIYRFMKEDVADLQREDPVFQASLIYGAFAYTLWTFFRVICTRIVRTASGKGNKGKKAHEELREAIPTNMSKSGTLFTVRNMSNIGASVLFLFTYVHMVTYIQNNRLGSTKSLNFFRKVFAKFSPLSMA